MTRVSLEGRRLGHRCFLHLQQGSRTPCGHGRILGPCNLEVVPQPVLIQLACAGVLWNYWKEVISFSFLCDAGVNSHTENFNYQCWNKPVPQAQLILVKCKGFEGGRLVGLAPWLPALVGFLICEIATKHSLLHTVTAKVKWSKAFTRDKAQCFLNKC